MDSLTVTIQAARAALGIGHTSLYRLINEGRLKTLKVGRRRLVTTASLREFVENSQLQVVAPGEGV